MRQPSEDVSLMPYQTAETKVEQDCQPMVARPRIPNPVTNVYSGEHHALYTGPFIHTIAV